MMDGPRHGIQTASSIFSERLRPETGPRTVRFFVRATAPIDDYFKIPFAACAAERRATGTRKGEQLT